MKKGGIIDKAFLNYINSLFFYSKNNYMKQYYFLFVILFFISCTYTPQNNNSTNSSSSAIIKDEPKRIPLPDGWHYGEVTELKGKDQLEINMLNQISTYNKALIRGDIDNARRHFYLDAIKYYSKFQTSLSDKEIVNALLKTASDEYRNISQVYASEGVNFEIFPIKFKKKVKDGSRLIYTFDITTALFNEKASIYADPDITVGISLNNGVNWTFIAKNSDTPNILRLRFSERVIDQVMER